MPDESQPATKPLSPTPETIGVWSDYAKDRFDFASKRVDEFRNWARQLAGVVGVVIGFELTLIGRILDLRAPVSGGLRVFTLTVFLGTVLAQVLLLFRVLRIGYSGHQLVGPESPTVLAQFVAEKDEPTTKQFVGAYYAHAYDRFRIVSEELGEDVGKATRVFTKTLIALLTGLGLLVWLSTSAYNQGLMSSPNTPAASNAPSPPVAQPQPAAPTATAAPVQPASPASPAPPVTSPLLVTPTPGERGTFSALPSNTKAK